MIRKAVLLAVLVATPGARPIEVPIHFTGLYSVEYWSASGFDPRQLTAEQYRGFVKSKACQVGKHGSALQVWPAQHKVVLLCEL